MISDHINPSTLTNRLSPRMKMHQGCFVIYVSGWALYAEHLGEELGIYKTPYDVSRRLFNEMFRAVRLVVDTGIHAFHWSKEQCVEYMTSTTGMPRTFASAEVDRYVTWPAQACSYKIGELKIKELRERSDKVLGKDFDVKDFHDVILKCGDTSLAFIEKKIEQYLKCKTINNQMND